MSSRRSRRGAAVLMVVAAAVGLAVAQSTDPAVVGQWSPTFNLPIIPVHTAVLTSGQVLIYDSDTSSATAPRLLDPNTLTTTAVPYSDAINMFCSGHTPLADGRIFVAGGHVSGYVGINNAAIFDPATATWTTMNPMTYARWYPSVIRLSDGKILVVSGAINCTDCTNPTASHLGIADLPEIYDPQSGNWTTLTTASLRLPLYPHIYLLPDGRVFAAATQEDPIVSQVLNLSTNTWSAVDTPHKYDGGSSAMYLPGKIVKSGSARNPDYTKANAAATTYVIDMTQANPAWRQTASMAFSRTQHNLVLLPDGKVIAIGGDRNSDVTDTANAVLQAEIWNPTTETWSTMAAQTVPRMYHSAANLLPDGRVLSTGGGHPPGFGVAQFAAEIYSPPYLFKGARPAVTSSPAAVNHGQTFFVETPDGAGITAVNLIAQGSTTHAFNTSARFLPLSFTQTTGGLNVTAPANGNLAPPGEYMLFLINSAGVPSVAAWLRIRPPWEDAQPPSAPGPLTASTSPGIVDLAWGAASDNVGVTSYDVYRSTVPGFVPQPSNRVGQTAATTYRDAGMAGGTYYYVVRARDAADNVGPSSNQVSVVFTPDTTPPTAPSSLNAAVVESGHVGLAWSASADDVGVKDYVVERCTGAGCTSFASAAAVTGTTYDDLGLAQTTAYRYRVYAEDAEGNPSARSNVVDVTTTSKPAGLVAAWSFNDGTGSILHDLSGLVNNGTLGGPTWTPAGKFGGGLSFNGADTIVTVADAASLDLTSAMTLEAWAIPRNPQSGYKTILHKNTDRYYLFTNSSSNVPATGGTFGSGNQNTYGPNALPVGVWSHVAGTFDGARVRLYVNGAEVANQAQTTPLTISADTLQIGGSVYGEYFDGVLDEIRIYNRALSAAEIQADMKAPILNGTVAVTLRKNGSNGIVLDWSDSAANGSYRVRRATGPTPADFSAATCWVVSGTTFTDPAAANNGVNYDYLVDAKASCP